MGTGRARELALTGRRIDAAEALELGVVDRIVELAELEGEATALAESLARRTLATLQGVRAAGWAHLDIPSALQREFELSIAAVLDPENVERMEAYLAQLGSR